MSSLIVCQTTPVPSILNKELLKNTILMTRPVSKYILYLPMCSTVVAKCSVYTQGDKSPILKTSYWTNSSCQPAAKWWARTTQESSCHCKKYTENTVSLTSLTLPRLRVSHNSTRGNTENMHVVRCLCRWGANLWVWFPFGFVSRFTSTFRRMNGWGEPERAPH